MISQPRSTPWSCCPCSRSAGFAVLAVAPTLAVFTIVNALFRAAKLGVSGVWLVLSRFLGRTQVQLAIRDRLPDA
jgi:hypothetical protein